MSEFYIQRTQRFDRMAVLNQKVFGEGFELNFANHACWLVHNEFSDVVGFCSYKVVNSDIIFLSRAGLLPCARGNGLQVRMIRTRLRDAKKQGYKTAITYTVPSNAQSFNSLQKTGFKLYIPENAWAGEEQLYWTRAI